MKKLILCLLLFAFISTGHSQIQLKEAKVDFTPESMKVDPITNSLVIEIPEKIAGEFEKDPLEFMKNKFDVQKFVLANKDIVYSGFYVNFKSRKGVLKANFTNRGDLVSTYQKFKNIRLPISARMQILEKHRDAVIFENKYVATTKGWELSKAHYQVKIRDGDKIKKLRIDRDKGQYTLTGL